MEPNSTKCISFCWRRKQSFLLENLSFLNIGFSDYLSLRNNFVNLKTLKNSSLPNCNTLSRMHIWVMCSLRSSLRSKYWIKTFHPKKSQNLKGRIEFDENVTYIKKWNNISLDIHRKFIDSFVFPFSQMAHFFWQNNENKIFVNFGSNKKQWDRRISFCFAIFYSKMSE